MIEDKFIPKGFPKDYSGYGISSDNSEDTRKLFDKLKGTFRASVAKKYLEEQGFKFWACDGDEGDWETCVEYKNQEYLIYKYKGDLSCSILTHKLPKEIDEVYRKFLTKLISELITFKKEVSLKKLINEGICNGTQ
jgi:hypothetical protein